VRALSTSKETLVLGLVLIGSGLSEVLPSLVSVSPVLQLGEIIGLALMSVGVAVFVFGQFWSPKSGIRPFGVAFLSFDLALGGILTLVFAVILSADSFLFISLLILSLAIFALAYLFLEGNVFGWIGIVLLTLIGVVGSIVGIGNAYVVNVPGVLGSVFILWYVFRPHVSKYFRQEPLRIDLKRKYVVLPLILVLVMLAVFSYSYADPPSRRLYSSMSESGGPWGGASSSDMMFGVNDVVYFSFNVTSKWPITFTIGLNYGVAPVVTAFGMNGTGAGIVPVRGQYEIFYAPIGIPEATLSVEITVKMYSLRPAFLQWILLSSDALFALSAVALFTKTETGLSSELERKVLIKNNLLMR
jgi:hypothetical protein